MSIDLEFSTRSPTRYRPPAWSDAEIHVGSPLRGWYARFRTATDYLVALCLCVVAVPFVLLAAVLVKCTSRGPVIYSQTRLGQNGRLFTLYKIRSMQHNCERETGPRWSNGRDPRVTPVGKLLRFTHIDELPQLWNVLRGEMSLIGPRPERPDFVYKLEASIPRYRERLQIKPGLSGLAQVQLPPDVDEDSVRRKLAYDLYYIEHIGFGLDARIFAGTALKMVGVSFRTLRWLFAMPSPEIVDAAYWSGVTPVSDPVRAQQQTG